MIKGMNFKVRMFGKFLPIVLVLISLLQIGILVPAGADVLQGGVERDQELYRLNRPSGGAPTNTFNGSAQQQSMRIARPDNSSGNPQRGLVDTSAFQSPLSGRADDGNLRGGLVREGDFAGPPPKNFDLGAEAGSREMVLAWERWHHQLSQAIYQRWSERAERPGRATVKVTVTRDRILTAQILSSNGGPAFDAILMDSIEGLNGNPGLAFPSKSLRQRVSFEADYIASHDVTPGYNWIHNDYEKVQQKY